VQGTSRLGIGLLDQHFSSYGGEGCGTCGDRKNVNLLKRKGLAEKTHPFTPSLEAVVSTMLLVLLGFSLAALPLAMMGAFQPVPVVIAASLLTAALIRLWGGRFYRLPTVQLSLSLVASVATLVMAVTAVNFAYSSQHLPTNRDPGVYVNTGLWLARTGQLVVEEDVGVFADFAELDYGGFGFYEEGRSGRLEPQFLHLLPAVLAVGEWLGGPWLLLRTNSLLGGVALLAFFTFATRIMRPWLAWLATAALSLNLVQIHFARDAYAEILTQVFLFGGLWALHVAETGVPRPGRGLVAGLLLGATCMTRIDALLYLIPLVLYLGWRAGNPQVSAPTSKMIGATTLGLLVGPILGLADGWFRAGRYLLDLGNLVVPLVVVVLGSSVVAAGLAARRSRVLALRAWLAERHPVLATAAAGLLLVVAALGYLLRPHLEQSSGSPIPLVGGLQAREGVEVDATRRYAEFSLRWLSWYLHPMVLLGGILGTGVAVRRALLGRARYLAAFLGVFLVTSVVYLWRPSITPDHIWAMRRFLPVTIPGLLLLGFWWAGLLIDEARAMPLVRLVQPAVWSRLERWALLPAALLFGLGLRWFVVASPIGGLDPDEAVTGLMALETLRGDPSTFYWGQFQGGSQESLLVAGLFLLVGPGRLAVKAVPLVLNALAGVLVWRLGLRLLNPGAARLAAILFWVASTSFIWWSTKARGHYSVLPVLQLAVVLLAVRIVQRHRIGGAPTAHRQVLDAALLGFFLGLGLWASPQIAYAGLPTLAWMLWELRAGMLKLWVAGFAGIVGAMPWLRFNLTSGWATFSAQPAGIPNPPPRPERLWGFFRQALPMAMGFRMPFFPDWIPPIVGLVLYLASLGAFAYVLFRRKTGLGIVLLIVGLYPLMFSFSPYYYIDEPRYLYFLWPFVALLGGFAADRLRRWAAAAPIALVILMAATSAVGIDRMVDRRYGVSGGQDAPLGGDVEALASILQREGGHHVFAPYLLAYPITFATAGAVTATPLSDVRYQPYDRAVRASSSPLYVFLAGSPQADGFRRSARDKGVDTACQVTQDDFVICRPSQPILPEELFAG
jgi:hypothetical protein